MDTRSIAQTWLDNVTDDELHTQLVELIDANDSAAIDDAFFQDLSFGTAGLRGIIGPGTNRMNIYTVGRATQGLANYINAHCSAGTARVAIARDSRHKGELFVRHAACVLAANGITAFVYPRIEPTPALSFAVRDLDCFAGICMTASHNPAAYNGYKVYGSDGCQITSAAADAISAAIAQTDPFTQVKTIEFDEALSQGLIQWIDEATLNRFIRAVADCGLVPSKPCEEHPLSIVYTPLHGTGFECVSRMFETVGISTVSVCEAQKNPNGDFPTCTYPNPETREALLEGIRSCEAIGADLLLATDPDADRVGVAVLHEGTYELPTGNEMGILLLDYICRQRQAQNSLPERPLAVSTIVSTAMIDAIAADYGVEVRRTLTGFKYIGDIIGDLEKVGEQDRFIFGFEESYGYLSGSHVRDKDAVNACLLICQMAQDYKNQNMDLMEALEALYRRYGYYQNRTINVSFPGAEGAKTMEHIMRSIRDNTPSTCAGKPLAKVVDYKQGRDSLPPANVVEYQLEDGLKIIFRPSGTEPKIKAYLFARGETLDAAQGLLDAMESEVHTLMGA